MGNVIISPNIKRSKVQIDANGNEVKPFTKEIIRKNEEEVIMPVQPVPVALPVAPETKIENPLSIQEQIKAAEKLVLDLRKKKQQQIEDMKKQIAELEGKN